MSDTGNKEKKPASATLKVQDVPLTIREHLDPDKHWIGETLAPPTQGEIEALVGTAAGPGESPFVARADHKHKLDPAAVTAITNALYGRVNIQPIPALGSNLTLAAGVQFCIGQVNMSIPVGASGIVAGIIVCGINTTVAGQVAVQVAMYNPTSNSGDFADTLVVGNNQIVALYSISATSGSVVTVTGIARALSGTHSVQAGRCTGLAFSFANFA